MSKIGFRALTWVALLSTAFVPAAVFAQADFYQGKTLTIIQGRDPGGTGDLRAKALVSFLQKYIRGNPTIVMEYMAGLVVAARQPITSIGRPGPTV